MEKAEQKQTAQTGTHIHTPSLRDLWGIIKWSAIDKIEFLGAVGEEDQRKCIWRNNGQLVESW